MTAARGSEAHSKTHQTPARARATVAACAALLALFAALAWSAVRTKCATYDEPLHSVAAFMHLYHHDFLVDPDNPPLWKFWAALLTRRESLHFERSNPLWQAVPADILEQLHWASGVLYQQGNDADGILSRCRLMMLVVGVALGAVTAWWSWRLGGAVAAIVATTLFALDPNFLAHAPLVKNDVVLALTMVLVCYATWRAGNRLTWGNAAAIMLLCGIGLTVKFSGVLLPVFVGLLLLLRAILPDDWPVLGRRLTSRKTRLGAVVCLGIAAALFSYGWIWACYGFRFAPDHGDPQARVNLNWMARWSIRKEFYLQHVATADPEWFPKWSDIAGIQPSLRVRLVLAAEARHLLPHAWLAGVLQTYQSTLVRGSFLLGEINDTGWWYYFPIAMLVKTPLATLLAGVLSLGVLGAARKAAKAAHQRWWQGDRLWAGACVGLPALLYLVVAMRSNLNLGLRHVLPIYPFIFIGMGVAAGYAYALLQWRRRAVATVACLALGLAVESGIAFPNYIAFFNAGVGGSRGGLRLLTDSNLDWGQDLKLLAQWQQAHPDRKLYLCYSGQADPRYYGLRYTNLFGSDAPGETVRAIEGPCVVAVGAAKLAFEWTHGQADAPGLSRSREPLEVLGGSIYLYEVPAPAKGP